MRQRQYVKTKTRLGSLSAGSFVRSVARERRWLHRNQIELGMYICELDRPWSQTRFLFQGFRIESVDVLEAVRDSCEYALVEYEQPTRTSV